MTLGDRLDELERLADKRGVDAEIGYLPSVVMAIQAYADVLGFDRGVVFNLEMSLKQIEQFSAVG